MPLSFSIYLPTSLLYTEKNSEPNMYVDNKALVMFHGWLSSWMSGFPLQRILSGLLLIDYSLVKAPVLLRANNHTTAKLAVL